MGIVDYCKGRWLGNGGWSEVWLRGAANKGQQREIPSRAASWAALCPSSSSTTSYTATQTMAAVHPLPAQLLAQYARQSINAGPSAINTPPIPTRKRKRAHQYTVSYSEVQEVDASGTLREVIVIDDTPPPPPTISPSTTHNPAYSASYQPPIYTAPIRTRARAAAEAQALSASSSSAATAPAPKKRKRDHREEVRAPAAKKPAVASTHTQAVIPATSWESRSAAATDDVRSLLSAPSACSYASQTSKGPVSCDDKEGHYIIVPDDIIHRRCKSPPCLAQRAFCLRWASDRTVRLLGQGTFGKVVEALDTETNSRVAIKIIRAIPKYRDASKIEVRVLQKLRERDPANRKYAFFPLLTLVPQAHVRLQQLHPPVELV